MNLTYMSEDVNLPDFIIVGAAKSGTTALYHYLKQHEKIFFSSVKEPWFFSFMGEKKRFKKPTKKGFTEMPENNGLVFDKRDYFALFQKASADQILGEASTSYLYTAEDTIRNIKEIYGDKYSDVKIIIVLRDPVERAWSHYKMHVRDGSAALNFNESMNRDWIKSLLEKGCNIGYDYIGFSQYYSQVKMFMENFPKTKIILHEELDVSTENTVREIFSFLEVSVQKIDVSSRLNVSGKPKNWLSKIVSNFIYKPNMIKKILKVVLPLEARHRFRVWLGQFLFKENSLKYSDRINTLPLFREDVECLEKLIGKDLRSWKI